MKKNLLMILTIILCLPVMVSAKELIPVRFNPFISHTGAIESSGYLKLSNGGFVRYGTFTNDAIDGVEPAEFYDAYVSFVDSKFRTTKNYSFGGEGKDVFYDAVELDNGNVVLVGESNSNDILDTDLTDPYMDAIIAVYNEKDGLVFYKEFGGNGYEKFYAVTVDSEGYIYAVGYSASTDIDGVDKSWIHLTPCIVKYNAKGEVVAKNVILDEQFLFAYDVKILSDGSILTVGIKYGLGLNNGNTFIINYDKNLNVKYEKNLDDERELQAYFVEPLYDGGYLLSGFTESVDLGVPNKGEADALLIRFDKNGNILWQKTMGGNGVDIFLNASVSDDKIYATFTSESTDIEGLGTSGWSYGIAVYDLDGKFIEYILPDLGVVNLLSTSVDDGVIYAETVSASGSSVYVELMEFRYQYGTYDFNSDDKGDYLVFIPDEGYEFYNVEYEAYDENGENVEIFDIVDGKYYIKDVEAEITYLFVDFKPIYEIKSNKAENGSFTVEKTDYNKGKITVAPNDGYEVDEVIIKDSTGKEVVYDVKDSVYTFTLTDDVTVTVTFKEKQKEIIKSEEEENPKTADAFIYYACAVVCSLFGIWSVEQYKRYKTIKG